MLEDVREDTAKESLSRRKEPGVQQVHTAQWNGADKLEPAQSILLRLLASPAQSRTPLWQAARRGVRLLLSEATRPVRFLCTGGVAALFQPGPLDALAHEVWNLALADITAFL